MGKAFLQNGSLMPLDKNLLQLRKSRGFTQEQMADITGLHINSVKAYEAGRSVPSAEVIKKIALAFSVTTDELIFDAHERAPKNDLLLQFEALSKLPDVDQLTISNLIDSLVVKHQTMTLAHSLGANRHKPAAE
ncbi:helix-turn-helix domain-containing protein [Halovulum sp. GXIMD14793]